MRWHLTDTAYPVPAHGAKFDVTTGAVAATRGSTGRKVCGSRQGRRYRSRSGNRWSKSHPTRTQKPIGNNLAFLRFRFYLVLHNPLPILFFLKNDLPNSFIRGCAFTGATLISLALFSSAIFKWFPKLLTTGASADTVG